jgi:hypothetical protein
MQVDIGDGLFNENSDKISTVHALKVTEYVARPLRYRENSFCRSMAYFALPRTFQKAFSA